MAINVFDIVAIYDADFNQVFENARPQKAIINEPSKSFEHPVETGETIVDDKVILPVEIQYPVIVVPGKVQDTYDQIKQSFINSDLFTIQTKTSIYINMYITALPHEEDPKFDNTITMAISFKEAQIARAVFGTLPATSVGDPQDISTQDRGEQNSQEKSVAASLSDSISDFFQ